MKTCLKFRGLFCTCKYICKCMWMCVPFLFESNVFAYRRGLKSYFSRLVEYRCAICDKGKWVITWPSARLRKITVGLLFDSDASGTWSRNCCEYSSKVRLSSSRTASRWHQPDLFLTLANRKSFNGCLTYIWISATNPTYDINGHGPRFSFRLSVKLFWSGKCIMQSHAHANPRGACVHTCHAVWCRGHYTPRKHCRCARRCVIWLRPSPRAIFMYVCRLYVCVGRVLGVQYIITII